MAVYRARWVCPFDKVPKYRDFTLRARALAFRDLPRPVPVAIWICKQSEVRR